MRSNAPRLASAFRRFCRARVRAARLLVAPRGANQLTYPLRARRAAAPADERVDRNDEPGLRCGLQPFSGTREPALCGLQSQRKPLLVHWKLGSTKFCGVKRQWEPGPGAGLTGLALEFPSHPMATRRSPSPIDPTEFCASPSGRARERETPRAQRSDAKRAQDGQGDGGGGLEERGDRARRLEAGGRSVLLTGEARSSRWSDAVRAVFQSPGPAARH